MTEDNRDKFIQIANRYGQLLKFYNVEELCAERIININNYFSNINDPHFSIAMFYRLFIAQLLPPEIEKAIYLDSDIIVNLDIAELWQVELGNKLFGAVPNLFQMKDEVAANERTKTAIPSVREGFIKPENYFNSGVLLMNLKVLREEEDNILAGIKFRSEHPQLKYFDQEVLNYCFSTSYLKLPAKFNRIIFLARLENEFTIEKKIYHYAAHEYTLGLYVNDPYNQLFMDYFIKTPWVDDDTSAALSGVNLSSKKNYTLSVVIPMYNAEEFIAECLDSLVIQTFQDFEIIVVDDCSTDNSRAIVEGYKEKFNSRLKLIMTKTNSGGGGYIPRNIGLMLTRGEYVYFLDADDMILATALETLYKAAILYDAEVIYTSSYYNLTAPNDVFLRKDNTKVEGKTNLIIDAPNKNLSRLLPLKPVGEDFHTPWTRFCRRDFLLENEIFFPLISHGGDFLWVISVYCHARRFLRISTPLCLHRRYNENSITRKVREPQEQCLYWFSDFINFTRSFSELERGNKVLAENPDYALATLKKELNWCLNRTEYARKEIDSEELFKALHSEFSKNFSDSSALLLPFFFSSFDSAVKINKYYSEIINKFNRYFTARVDIKFMSTEGDFQIVSVSDSKATVWKPAWFQKGGIGYQIQTYAGNVQIIAKATADGQINLELRGLDIRRPEDKTKRIPYWIDYTKLLVNDKVIFDEVTPAWHDKAYIHRMEVKTGDEIKIQVEWLPHRSDTPAQVIEKSEPIAKGFLPYLTARMDVKLKPNSGEGDFQIVSVSDSKATVWKPDWFQKGGIGYQIQSYASSMEIIVKATADGQINLALRGVDIKNPEDKTKRIPYWIDYTKLLVNGKVIFNELTPAWHNKAYFHNMQTKAGEEIKIQVEWLPHRSDV